MAEYKAKLPAMRDWLIQVARSKSKITYGQMMAAFGIDRFSLRHAMDFLGHQADNFGEPIITSVIVSTRTQRCSPGLKKEFGVEDDDFERDRLYVFWSADEEKASTPEAEATDLEVRAARFVSVEARPSQAAFRRQVYLACNGRCVISGCDVLKALDAAHLHGRNWRKGHNNAEDGILLRKDLHALYDSNLLRINADGKVVLHPSISGHYAEFSGTSTN